MVPKINICITCVGGRLIYDVIRAIRDAKDYKPFIIGIDSNKNAHGRLLCDSFFTVPHSEIDPKAWLSKIKKINSTFDIDILLVFSEGETILIAKNIKLLKDCNIKVAVNAYKIVKTLTDKLLLLTSLKEKGLEVGKFFDINSKQDVINSARLLNYPQKKIVLKPRNGRGSRGVLIANSRKKKFTNLIPERFCGTGNLDCIFKQCIKKNIKFRSLICTPFYEGRVWDVDVLAHEGKIINIAARERQLKNPLWPTSTGHKSSNNKKVIDYVQDICSLLKLSGPNDFDIVIDKLGNPKVLDAASRFSGSVGVSNIAGVNMLSQLIRYILKIPYKRFIFKENLILRPYITMVPIPKNNELDYL
ncbi:MAG: hypothetical protein CBE11_03750 [Rickettsiales bacterium TMED251]|nr:MAG: hypothetical protein CBE11_03750 [Rickettsiales bacterium TMED251]|tara:strand:- start:1056 stop:2135 length:1080 start_codon:yes stop_codon:yes gene_type:complete